MRALFVMFLCSASAFAQDAKDIKGIFQEVDVENGTITLRIHETGKVYRLKTFNLLKPDLPVTTALGKPAPLKEIEVDARLTLKLEGDDVTAIAISPAMISAYLKHVDAKNRIVTYKHTIGEKTLPLLPDAKVLYSGSPVELSEIKSSKLVNILFSEDRKAIAEIRAGKGGAPEVHLTKMSGVLFDFDAGKQVATIWSSGQNGDASLLHEYPLLKDATYSLAFQSKPFRDLTAQEVRRGVKIVYWLEAGAKKIMHMELEMPILAKRAVVAFDRSTGLLSLEGPEGPLFVHVAENVKLPRGKTLDDLRSKARVQCGLSVDRKRVEIIDSMAP